eukprot:1924465-Amphidinium_carterae.1
MRLRAKPTCKSTHTHTKTPLFKDKVHQLHNAASHDSLSLLASKIRRVTRDEATMRVCAADGGAGFKEHVSHFLMLSTGVHCSVLMLIGAEVSSSERMWLCVKACMEFSLHKYHESNKVWHSGSPTSNTTP